MSAKDGKRCESCQALMINGVYCHEIGCPDAWKDETRQCKWCGSEFNPEEREQLFCEHECYACYYGYPADLDSTEVE